MPCLKIWHMKLCIGRNVSLLRLMSGSSVHFLLSSWRKFCHLPTNNEMKMKLVICIHIAHTLHGQNMATIKVFWGFFFFLCNHKPLVKVPNKPFWIYSTSLSFNLSCLELLTCSMSFRTSSTRSRLLG